MHCCFVVLFVLATSLTASAQGWEWLNPLPQGNGLGDLEYCGSNQLYSTGSYGSAIGSTDGGETWTIRETGEHACPFDVEFVSPNEGWGITGDYAWRFGDQFANTIFHTTDGGVTWLPQYHSPLVSLSGISFPSAESGWAVGAADTAGHNLVILHTTNGGLTWTEQVHDSSGSGHLFFLNEEEGWISHQRGVLHTNDGGISWQWYSTPYWFYFDLMFEDSDHGWGVGLQDVYRTTDGGQTWVPQLLPDANNYRFRSVAVAGPNQIWVTADGSGHQVPTGRIYHSDNAGQTWTHTVLDSVNILYDIVFSDSQHGWICGSGGVVYQTADGGATWSRRAGAVTTNAPFYFPAVSCADQPRGGAGATPPWPVETGARILHTTDGGESWFEQFVDSNGAYIHDIKAVSSTNIWAVGSHILHSTDGGVSWVQVTIGDVSWGRSIACPDDQVVWIVSNDMPPQVHRSTDGGITWESHDVEDIWKYNTMTACDANNIWVTAWWDLLDEGEVSHSSDGGVTWESQLELGGQVDAIFFADSLHGWAKVWYSGLWTSVSRTTDGGDTWVLSEDTLWGFDRIQFVDTLNGWATGYSTYRSTDGGITWQEFNPRVENWMRDANFISPTQGWLVGWDSILRFDGSIFTAPDVPAASPASFTLLPAYPNPFNAVTTLSFDLPAAGRVRVEIFDITGRLVQTLADQMYSAGRQSIYYDASELSSGLYFARASSGSLHAVQKIVLLK